jgi:chitinase
MNEYVDIWTLGSYDYILPTLDPHGTNISGYCSNYEPHTTNSKATPYNTQDALNFYIDQKTIPGSKIHIGIPLYATEFHETDGVGLKCTSIKHVELDLIPPSLFAATLHDLNAHAAYTYNETARIMTSFECIDTTKFIADVVKARGLGGLTWIKAIGQRDGTLLRHVSDDLTLSFLNLTAAGL